jgi:hypothetical protein
VCAGLYCSGTKLVISVITRLMVHCRLMQITNFSPLTPRFRAEVIHMGFMGDRVALGESFSPSTSVFHCQMLFHHFPITHHLGPVYWTHLRPHHQGTQPHPTPKIKLGGGGGIKVLTAGSE